MTPEPGMTTELLEMLTPEQRQWWIDATYGTEDSRLTAALLELAQVKKALAELRTAVEAAPCSGGDVPDQFGHQPWCWKSRLPK